MYIYLLTYQKKQELCYILDQNDKWEELGRAMQYDIPTLNNIKKIKYNGGSPTSELLITWGHQNHTVLELFVLLSRMKIFRAMSVIKDLVDEKYHYLLQGKEDDHIHKQENKHVNIIDSKIKPENFNENYEKLFNAPKSNLVPLISRDNNENNTDIPIVAESAGAIPSISYVELQKSTNNWDESTLLGRGGFGKVYKGIWKCTQVAIKRLEIKGDKPNNGTEQIRQSITELHFLNAYRHDNVLPLYGYSIGGPHPCLIYQFMAGGSLEKRLRIRDLQRVLEWPTRLNIAIGAARGLQFLHTNMINGKPLVHGDIKSANILLDANDQARIGDFGLAREGPQSQFTYIKVSRIFGTPPYLPDEFLRAKKFSTKVDTYSFGVVLFEVATSLPPYSERREEKFLKDHVVNFEGDVINLKDKRKEGYDSMFKGVMDIGKLCVKKRAKERPEMVSVLMLLEKMSLQK